MEQTRTAAVDWRTAQRGTGGHDAQYAELIETVWACERAAEREARLDALLRVARNIRP
jgi:hypothetical protein